MTEQEKRDETAAMGIELHREKKTGKRAFYWSSGGGRLRGKKWLPLKYIIMRVWNPIACWWWEHNLYLYPPDSNTPGRIVCIDCCKEFHRGRVQEQPPAAQ